MKIPRGNPLMVLFPLALAVLAGCHDKDLPTALTPRSARFSVTAGDYVVNSTDDVDDGTCDATHCSLREAVTLANAAGAAKTITFSIPGCDVSPCTITLGANLPQITSGPGITIDGSGQKVAVSGNNTYQVTRVVGTGTLTVKNLTIENSSCPCSGGAIWNASRLTVVNSVFSGNTSTWGGGGAIINQGTLTVVNSTFTGNAAPGSFGGAIQNFGTVTVERSTFSGNTADGYGGGIYNAIGSTATLAITNSTFSGNSARWYGGGIYNGSTGPVTVTSSTFSGNVASLSLGSGIFVVANTNVSLRNTIMAGTGALCGGSGGTITDDGYNLDNGTSCGFNASGSLSNTDPMLGPLADNGGPTLTHALLSASPAIDAGVCTDYLGTTIGADQRGVNRPQGSTCDIGAFEVLAWSFTGFFAPVDNSPVVNVVKAGSAIPVKFGLGGDRGLDIFANGYPMAPAVPCTAGAPTDGLTEVVSAGSSSLSYDASTDTYTYVWKTDKTWANTCRALTLKFIDGTTKTASFQFTK